MKKILSVFALVGSLVSTGCIDDIVEVNALIVANDGVTPMQKLPVLSYDMIFTMTDGVQLVKRLSGPRHFTQEELTTDCSGNIHAVTRDLNLKAGTKWSCDNDYVCVSTDINGYCTAYSSYSDCDKTSEYYSIREVALTTSIISYMYHGVAVSTYAYHIGSARDGWEKRIEELQFQLPFLPEEASDASCGPTESGSEIVSRHHIPEHGDALSLALEQSEHSAPAIPVIAYEDLNDEQVEIMEKAREMIKAASSADLKVSE